MQLWVGCAFRSLDRTRLSNSLLPGSADDPVMGRRERTVLLVIFTLVALALRIGYVLTTEVDVPIRADAAQYFACAQNLVAHGTFSTQTGTVPRPDSFRSPGYPAFLATVLGTVGRDRFYLVVLLIQAMLGALVVPLAYRLARTFASPAIGLASAALTALSPHLVTSCGYLLSEAVTAPLLGAALLAISICRRRSTTGRCVCSGLLLTALYLVQEATLPLPFAFAVWLGWRPGLRRPAAILFAVFALGAGAWQVRCRVAVPEGAATAQQRVLATLSHGTYPGLVHTTESNRYYPYRDDPEQPEFGRSWPRFVEVFSARFAARPWRHVAWYLFEKPVWLWSWGILQGQGDVFVYPVRHSLFEQVPVVDAIRVAMRWLHPFLVIAMVLACLMRRVPAPVVVTLIWFTVLHSLFLPDPRYLVPLKPLLFATALPGIAAVLTRLRLGSNTMQLTKPA